MTTQEIDLVRHALEILHRLLPEDEPCRSDSVPPPCPVECFAREYLTVDLGDDLTCEAAWLFFKEIADAGELSPMRKVVFLRKLPIFMESVHGVRKCHSIERAGRRVRGFRGVSIRLGYCPVSVHGATPDAT